MKETIYMIFSKTRSKRITKTPPYLRGDEIAIKLNLVIPDKFFDKYIPETELTIPEEYVIEPKIVAKIVAMGKDELTEIQKTVEIQLEKFIEPVDDCENPEDDKVDRRNPLGDIFEKEVE